ncbi:GWxTD domain-containing protein [Gemmatimonadota bacterium]
MAGRYSHIRKFLFLLLILVVCLVHEGCSGRRYSYPGYFTWRISRLVEYVATEEESNRIRESYRNRDDSMVAALEDFWSVRDPLPETELNEYRNRFEGRVTAGWDSLISPLTGEPDGRITPYIYFGLPTSIKVLPHSLDDALVYWVYTPDFEVPESASDYPQLRDLEFSFSFVRDAIGVHRRDREGGDHDPALPYLTPDEMGELEAILLDEEEDIRLRMTAAWRLRADPTSQPLGILLRAAALPDTLLRKVIQAAIQPLEVAVDDQTGNIQPIAAEVDSFHMRRYGTYDRDLLYRMRRIALLRGPTPELPDSLYLAGLRQEPFDPASELPEEDVVELLEIAERDRDLLHDRGWLSQAEAESLYSGVLGRARDLLDSENPLDAHTMLEPLLRHELSGNPEAWHLDALAMLETHEPGGRAQAEEKIRKAQRLAPGNLRYQLTLANILSRRTFDVYADQNLNRILEEAPSLAGAYALKARIRLEVVWRLGWRAGGWGTPLPMQGTSRSQQIDEALGLLDRALVLEPDNEFATWWLGMHYILTGRWIDVIRVMNYLIDQGQHLAEAYLGRGLAFQTLGQFDLAWQDYLTGLELLPDHVHQLADDPRWAMPPSIGGVTLRGERAPSQGRPIAAGVSADRESGQQSLTDRDLFWRARDPLFATGLNERLMEQYRRFAHVTWHFALPQLGLKGWQTHRGRIYLRYGEPMTQTELERWRLRGGKIGEGVPEELALDSQAGRSIGLVQYEYWYYEGFRIPLEIGMLTGNRTVPVPRAYERLMETIPESPRVTGGRDFVDLDRIDLGSTWYRFENPGGDLELILHSQYPKLEFFGLGPDDEEQFIAGLTLLGPDWQRIAYQDFELQWWQFMHDRSMALVAPPILLPRAQVPTGDIYCAIEVIPDGAGPVFSARDTMSVPEWDALRMSSLVMAGRIEEGEAIEDLFPGTYLKRSDRAIIPLQHGAFHRYSPVFLYFEIYGLENDEFGAHRYEMTVETREIPENTSRTTLEEIGRLFGRDQQEGMVRLFFERDGISDRAAETFEVLFDQNSDAMDFLVTLQIRDLISDRVVKESIVLEGYRAPHEIPPSN